MDNFDDKVTMEDVVQNYRIQAMKTPFTGKDDLELIKALATLEKERNNQEKMAVDSDHDQAKLNLERERLELDRERQEAELKCDKERLSIEKERLQLDRERQLAEIDREIDALNLEREQLEQEYEKLKQSKWKWIGEAALTAGTFLAAIGIKQYNLKKAYEFEEDGNIISSATSRDMMKSKETKPWNWFSFKR